LSWRLVFDFFARHDDRKVEKYYPTLERFKSSETLYVADKFAIFQITPEINKRQNTDKTKKRISKATEV